MLQLLTVAVAVIGFSLAAPAQAQWEPMEGWAWSNNTGWIEFPSMPNPYISSPDWSRAGVLYNTTNGNLRGWAWSHNLGWVKFGQNFGESCPGRDHTADTRGGSDSTDPCQSHFSTTTGEFSGWARVCSATVGRDCASPQDPNAGGFTGWVSLNCANHNPVSASGNCTGPADYAMHLASGPNPKRVLGHAWGTLATGWILPHSSLAITVPTPPSGGTPIVELRAYLDGDLIDGTPPPTNDTGAGFEFASDPRFEFPNSGGSDPEFELYVDPNGSDTTCEVVNAAPASILPPGGVRTAADGVFTSGRVSAPKPAPADGWVNHRVRCTNAAGTTNSNIRLRTVPVAGPGISVYVYGLVDLGADGPNPSGIKDVRYEGRFNAAGAVVNDNYVSNHFADSQVTVMIEVAASVSDVVCTVTGGLASLPNPLPIGTLVTEQFTPAKVTNDYEVVCTSPSLSITERDSISLNYDGGPNITFNSQITGNPASLVTVNEGSDVFLNIESVDQVEFDWEVSGVNECDAIPGSLDLTGADYSNLNFSTTYTGSDTDVNEPSAGNIRSFSIRCRGPIGTRAATINVNLPDDNVDLFAEPRIVDPDERNVDINWSITGRSSAGCTLTATSSPDYFGGTGPTTNPGSVEVNIEGETTFELRCPSYTDGAGVTYPEAVDIETVLVQADISET